ncbi:MAG TPA: hypothetical protein VGD71_25570 [Kribbella sp.]
MDGVVLLLFATLFTALVVTTTNSDGNLRTSVRRIGPLVALESRGNGPKLGNVGSVCACYSLLICVISGYALTRRRARVATGPQEG